MKKQILIIIHLQVLLVMELTAQVEKPVVKDTLNRKGIVLYVNQPLGFINKVRLKAGYKNEYNSTYLLSFTNFYGNFPLFLESVEYSGPQFCFEYQYALTKGDIGEIFMYGKVGFGNYNYKNEDIGFFNFSPAGYGAGSYILLGGGFGQELFFNKSKTFFLQINEGVKVCNIYQFTGVNPESDFQSFISPGSIIDFNFGLRF